MYGDIARHDAVVLIKLSTRFLITIFGQLIALCDRVCKNRACGHKLHLSHNRSYLSNEIEHLHSVTCCYIAN